MQLHNFNPDLLTVARDLRMESQASLAKKLTMSQGHLSKIENGVVPPDINILNKISKVLYLPPEYFVQSERVYGAPMSAHTPKFRKPASVPQKSLDRITAELNMYRINIRTMLKSIDFSASTKLPRYDIEDFNGSPADIAELVRKAWLLPKGPIKNLTECLEQAGVIVVWCDLSYANVDGVTLVTPDVPPCIFLNKNRPADRMRFSLAHEIGHIVMHRQPRPDSMEIEANKFASALLMPEREFITSCRSKIDMAELARLKIIWRVSMQAALYRIKDLGLITDNQNTSLWRLMSYHGYRKQEPASTEFPKEQPTILSQMLDLHIHKLGYSIDELAQALCWHTDEFINRYGINEGTAPKLYVVK